MNFFIGKHKFLEMFDEFFVNLKKHYNKESRQKLRNLIAEYPSNLWSLILSKIVICKDKADIGLVYEERDKHSISLFHRNDNLHLKIKSNNEEEKEKILPSNNHNFVALLKEVYDFIKHVKYKK